MEGVVPLWWIESLAPILPPPCSHVLATASSWVGVYAPALDFGLGHVICLA